VAYDADSARSVLQMAFDQNNNILEGPALAEFFGTNEDCQFRSFLEKDGRKRNLAVPELREELIPVQKP